MTSEIAEKMDRIDWDFPGSTTSSTSPHSLFRFPGNFLADIPAFLTEILTQPGESILDPFCGSGTTLVEAVIRGRRAIGIDSNSIAPIISDAKLTLICNETLPQQIDDVLSSLEIHIASVEKSGRMNDPELLGWFHLETISRLEYLWNNISHQSSNFFNALFFEVLFDCAAALESETSTGKRRRHHWGWVADNVKPKHLAIYDPVKRYRRKLIEARSICIQKHVRGDYEIIKADARVLPLESSSIDHVITSPPYIGMIDYTLANRLVYLWEGINYKDDFSLEIGARRSRNRHGLKYEYLSAMRKSLEEIKRVLKPGGLFAIILGNSRKHDGVSQEVLDVVSELMNLTWGPKIRIGSRRRVSDRKGSSASEQLAVFTNE